MQVTESPTHPTIVDGVVYEFTENQARQQHLWFVLGDRDTVAVAGERVYHRLAKRRRRAEIARRREVADQAKETAA